MQKIDKVLLCMVLFFMASHVRIFAAEAIVYSADFSSTEISTENLTISTYKARYNTAYGESWLMYSPGSSYLNMRFQLPRTPEKAVLRVIHLSSASAGVRGGGYSPVTIIINRKIFLSSYDVAENHDGSHAFETDKWDITDYLQTGDNIINWQFCNDAVTNYWIKELEIKIETRSDESSQEFDESACTQKTIDGFVITSVHVKVEKNVLRDTLEFAAKKAIGKLISMGVKYLVGLASKVAGTLAGHATGFFLAFINQIQTAGTPTRIDYGFISKDGFSTNLRIKAGDPINLVINLQPGDEINPLPVKVVNENGTVEYSTSISYEELYDMWRFDNKILIISSEPLIIQVPGKYRFGNAKLRVN